MDSLMKVAAGFMAAKMLFAATELGIFEQLAAEPATVEGLAERLAVPLMTLRIVCDAMVALGILTCTEGRYANTAAATRYLAGLNPDTDLRPFMRMRDRFSYPRWETLEAAVRAGRGVLGSREFADAEEVRIHAKGVEGFTRQAARALSQVYDFARHERLIDIGGGRGIFLTEIADKYKEIGLTLFELPAVTEVARRHLENGVHANRIEIVAGDFLHDPIPEGYDALLLANVVHVLSEQTNRMLMRSLRARVEAGARILLVDFFMNDERTEPLFAALMSGEFLIFDGEGRAYAENECRDWLGNCGWRPLERRALTGPSSLLVAEAI